VLITDGTEIIKVERNMPASWPEMRGAKACVVRTLMEHSIDVSPSDIR
jgi:hypothetical protein